MIMMKTLRFTTVALLSSSLIHVMPELSAAEPETKIDEKPKTETPVNDAAKQSPSKPIPSDEELKKMLTPIQYAVTRQNGTERPFTNEFWQHKEEGIYVDIISGEPLFSSIDKFDTDCGWPAFSKPINDEEIKNLTDLSHGMQRIEVRSDKADAHLGHVFNDGPKELGGLRYCINSAALRFIPKEKMQEAGYGNLLKIFEEKAPQPAAEKP